MSSENQYKQCICPECGAIAEVRHRKNGKKLRFMVCKHGHGGVNSPYGKAEYAPTLQKMEQDYIGEYGSYPETPSTSPDNVQEESSAQSPQTSDSKATDWTPTPDETPEALESENTQSPDAKNESEVAKDDDISNMAVKLGLAVLTVVGVAFGVKKLNATGGGAQ